MKHKEQFLADVSCQVHVPFMSCWFLFMNRSSKDKVSVSFASAARHERCARGELERGDGDKELRELFGEPSKYSLGSSGAAIGLPSRAIHV